LLRFDPDLLQHFIRGARSCRNVFPSYDQCHSDGLEFEVAGFFTGAVCQGTLKQAVDGIVYLYHVAWTFDTTGALNGYWDEHATDTVSADGKSYSGT
jgi:hypothetical protein